MYSDMSIRTRASSLPKRNSARARANSVLPTPVGPRKMKLPMGFFGSFKPVRLRRMAWAIAWIASFWPITLLCSSSSMWTSFCCSDSVNFMVGMPVHLETTAAMSSPLTTGTVASRCSRQDLRASSSWRRISFSLSRNRAAFSYS
jgi:hypothetical protein